MKNGLLLLATMVLALGCEPPPKTPPSGTPAVSPNVPTPPAGVPTPSDSGANPTAPATGTNGGIPPELINKVNELVRLTKEYNAIAAKVQTLDDYKQQQDALNAIDQQLEPYVVDLEIEQAKLSPTARAEFDRKYFEGLAKPIVAEKKAHTDRFLSLQ
jgi:hypothetical protein